MPLSMWGHTCLGLLCLNRVSPLSTSPGKVELAAKLPLEKSTARSGPKLCSIETQAPHRQTPRGGAANFTCLLPIPPALSLLLFSCILDDSGSSSGLGILRQVEAGGMARMAEVLPGSGCSSEG